MKTVEEIIAYLETELKEAYEMHEKARGKDSREALFHIIRTLTIETVLEEIKE